MEGSVEGRLAGEEDEEGSKDEKEKKGVKDVKKDIKDIKKDTKDIKDIKDTKDTTTPHSTQIPLEHLCEGYEGPIDRSQLQRAL